MEPAETKHLERAARFDLSSEGKHYRMAGLNLLAAIVIYWNGANLDEAVRQRKHAGADRRAPILAHISPLDGSTSSSPANTSGQNADSGLSVRFCPLPESTRGHCRAIGGRSTSSS